MGFGLDLAHRIDQFAAHQVKRRLGVDDGVIERIGEDLGGPYQPGLHALEEEQLNHPEEQRTGADEQPNRAHVAHEAPTVGVHGEYAEESRVQPQHQGHQRPDGVQNHFTAQVVADFDFLFVFMRRVVDPVIPLGLKEKMAGLAADHRDQPADQRRLHGIKEHRDIRDDEADCTQKVQGLIDPAVMVVAMIVPALSLEFRQKALHVGFLGK